MDDTNRKRNMERRRETSRYAARDRRGKEADIFGDLRDVVPIVEEGTVTHLDRIALLRVASTVCRLRKTAGNVLENELDTEKKCDVWKEDTITECLDGFLIIADSDSTILYVTESVAIYLGLTQTDLTGRTLKDFLHPNDYDEMVKMSAELHKPKTESDDENNGVNVVFRMKTVISPRGRCLNLKSALFKPVSFLVHSKVSSGGHVLLMQGITIPAGQGSINANASSLTKYTDTPTGAFMTRHTCDMRISFVSDRFNYILRSELKSLMGTSFYDLVHPADVAIVAKSMKELFTKGHIRTPYYRLIAANNTLAWVQTEATTISHTTKGQKGQYVICIHYVLGIQGADESLIVCTDNMPAGMQVDIKKEIDDTRDYIGRQPEIIDCVDFTPLIGNEDSFDCESLRPIPEPPKITADMGTRKNSFDDVLQWLFRDQPSSPPPTRYRSLERSERSTTRFASSNDDPSLASAQFMDSSSRSSRSKFVIGSTISSPQSTSASTSASSSVYGRRAQSQGSGRNSSQAITFSPLVDGISQCGINSPPSVGSCQMQYGDNRSVVGLTGSTDTTRRFSAVQASDSIDVPSAGLSTPTAANNADMFAALSSANSNAALTTNCIPTESIAPYQPIICDDLQWEEPDLSGLAPFVDTCDMLQIDDTLPPELQALYDLPDFTPAAPSVPAARAVFIDSAKCSPPAKRMLTSELTMDFSNSFNNPYQQQSEPQFQSDIFWQQNQQQQQQQQYSAFQTRT